MKFLRVASALALLLAGCAGNSDLGLLATETQTLTRDKLTVTLGFTDLAGCHPTGGVLQNGRDEALGYMYVPVFAVTPDGRTVGGWSISFPPTIPGGSAKAAAITGDNSGLPPCSGLRFYLGK